MKNTLDIGPGTLTALKWVGYVLGVLAGLWLLVWLGRKVVALFTQRLDEQLGAAVNPSQLTYEPAYYGILANRLQGALEGAGTDEATVYSIFDQLQTKDDLLKLISTFGYRDSTTLGVGNEGNMIDWLTAEMSVNDLQPVRDTFNRFNIPF